MDKRQRLKRDLKGTQGAGKYFLRNTELFNLLFGNFYDIIINHVQGIDPALTREEKIKIIDDILRTHGSMDIHKKKRDFLIKYIQQQAGSQSRLSGSNSARSGAASGGAAVISAGGGDSTAAGRGAIVRQRHHPLDVTQGGRGAGVGGIAAGRAGGAVGGTGAGRAGGAGDGALVRHRLDVTQGDGGAGGYNTAAGRGAGQKLSQLKKKFPSEHQSLLKYFISEYSGATLQKLIQTIEGFKRNSTIVEGQSSSTRRSSTVKSDKDQFLQMMIIPPIQYKQYQRFFDLTDGKGQTFEEWIKQHNHVKQKINKLIINAKNLYLDQYHVFNVSGNGFCLFNTWAQYIFLISSHHIPTPIPKIFIDSIAKLKQFLNEAYNRSPQNVKNRIDSLKTEDKIQNFNERTNHIDFTYFELFPYFSFFPVDVLCYSINKINDDIVLISDTRQPDSTLPLMIVFIIGEVGHFRLLIP